jgi:predicted protein tyrosine phosphatase
MGERLKVLFVCAQNRIRSVAAESLFAGSQIYDARSAGINHDARVRITPGLIGWADKIFVMEKEHRDRLRKKFKAELGTKEVTCLFVPDEFDPMEPDLIEMLRARLASHLDVPE